MSKFIAIDPGVNGGIAFHDGKTAWVHDLGTIAELIELLEPMKDEPYEVYLEDIQRFSNMPYARAIVYASSWGSIKGVVQALKFRMHLVSSQTWQKKLSLGNSKGMTKTQWKNKLKTKAQELYPTLKLSLKTADAILILEYARGLGSPTT